MTNHPLENMTLAQYLHLKKQVNELYEIMMEMHAQKRRDAIYANARAAYMEKKNLLQQAMELYPEYEKD
jgi:hypothetical protein